MRPPIAAGRGEHWADLGMAAPDLPVRNRTFRTLIYRAREGNILHYTIGGRKTHRGRHSTVIGDRSERGRAGGLLELLSCIPTSHHMTSYTFSEALSRKVQGRQVRISTELAPPIGETGQPSGSCPVHPGFPPRAGAREHRVCYVFLVELR